MAFGCDVDTLSLTFDKLQYIFNGYDQILDSFLEASTAYKNKRISDAEFFDMVQLGVMRFSALEFLAIKALFEIKKAMDRNMGIIKADIISEGLLGIAVPTPNHSIASFIDPRSLQQPHHATTHTKQVTNVCSYCGNQAKTKASFCTNCGKKLC